MFMTPAEGSNETHNNGTGIGIDLEQESIIQEGKSRFIQTCAYCHGQEGEAGKTRPFKTHTNWDPQAIFDTISNGRQRGGNIMPTWKDSIPPEEIWKIVAYIKSLSASK
ncbi:cytochrome c [Dechloromonas sp. HYN0024]|uniref:c-type cytochrome n=1 Tax=Dechloromonas sp. HYN0024 TaxID=2231055 RepID=UPI0013C30782|nr:cytochrome c [Dechloromonas sp. HYN0024]